MPQITLNDTNYSGYSADITFSAYTGGSTFLGTHLIPYTFTADYYFGTYSLYYPQFNKTCEYTVTPSLTMTINTSVNCQYAYFYIESYIDSFDLIIDWGDGSPLDYSYQGGSSYQPYHGYLDQLIYTITIYCNNPTVVTLLTSSPSTYGYGCGNVTNLSGLELFPNLSQIYFDNNILDSNAINSILISLSGTSVGGGVIYLNNQTPSACPSGDGLLALNHLVNDLGWNVQYDFTCPPSLEITVDTTIWPYPIFTIYSNTTSFNMVIDWGDGSGLDYSNQGSSYYTPQYYSYNSGQIYTIKMYFNNPSVVNYFEIANYGPYVTNINNITLLTNLENFYSNGQLLTNGIDLSNLTSLQQISIESSQLSSINISGCTNLYYVDLYYNNLPGSTINDVLITLSGNSVTGGYAYLQYQTPPACPTGDGILAQNHLVNDLGWNVNVDSGCPQPITITFNTSFAYWYIAGSDIFDMSINWGDGSPVEHLNYGSNYEISHSFLTLPATATIVFADNTIITQIDLTPNYADSGAYNNVTSITGLDILTNLQYLSLDGNLFSTFTSTLPNSLLGLGLSSNQLTTFNSTLPSSLTSLGLSSNQLTTFNSTLPSSLTSLGLASNQLTTFNSTLPSSITNLNLSNNQLIQNSYNNVLIELSGNGTSNGTVRLNNQIPAICPTGGGVTAKDYLTNTLNWNVVIDIDCYPNIFEILFDTNIDLSFNGNIFGFPLTSTNSIVDYGDGDSQVFVNTAINLGHSYQDYTGIKTIKIALSDPNLFNLVSFIGIPGIIGVNNLNLLSSLNQIQISDGTSLSQSSVNYILTTLSGMSFSNGYIILNNQTTVACPSGNGISAKNYLLGLNNTILTDDCPILTIDLDITSLFLQSIGIVFTGDTSFDFLVDWNDGTTSAYTGNNIYLIKTYTQLGVYNVSISITGATYINYITSIPNKTIINIGQFDKLTNLNYLNLEGNKITSLPTLPNSITYLNLNDNKLDNLGIENTINSFTGYSWTTPFIDLRGQQYPAGCLQLYTTTAYNNYVSLTNAGWTIYVDFCPYYPVTLSYNSEVCDTFNTLFTEYYVDANLGVSVGSTLYIDSLGATVAPDGYYTKNNLYPALPDILIVSGGTGEIIEITLCDIGFLGNYNLGGLPALCDNANDAPEFYSKNGVVTIGEKVYINVSPYSQLVLWNTTGLISRNNFNYYQINNGIIGPYAGTCTNI